MRVRWGACGAAALMLLSMVVAAPAAASGAGNVIDDAFPDGTRIDHVDGSEVRIVEPGQDAPGAGVSGAGAAAAPASSGATVTGTVRGAVTCAEAGGPFPDVSVANSACDNIFWLAGTGITRPIGGKFAPRDAVNRGSMTAFLYRMIHPGKAAPKCTSRPFRDVPVDHLFCGTIAWAADNGIAYGYVDGTYRPGVAVTRGAMAAFLTRIAADGPRPVCTRAAFDDVPADHLFCSPVTWMAANRITFGVGDGSDYGVREPVTRQAMASFLRRIAVRTDAAPLLDPREMAPLGDVWAVVSRVGGEPVAVVPTDGAGVYRATGLAAGSYTVCFDGAAATGGVRATYLDGCHGGAAWPWTEPSAPADARVVTVAADSVVRGVDAELIRAPKEAKPAGAGHRIGTVAKPAVASSSYELLTDSLGDYTFTWNACRPIHYVVNNVLAPTGADAIVVEAIETIARASGYRFIYDGRTNETISDAMDRSEYQPGRYGERWAPMIISWQGPSMNPVRFRGAELGWAGPVSAYPAGAGSRLVPTSGHVLLNGTAIGNLMTSSGSGTTGRAMALAVVMHELAHVLGLAHVDDTRQLMFPMVGTDRLTFAAGDLNGLYRQGSAACVVHPTLSQR